MIQSVYWCALLIGWAHSQSDDIGTKAGLLADLLGNHPQGNPTSSDLQEGRQSRSCCCLQSGGQCPQPGDFNNDDYDDYDGAIIPRRNNATNSDTITTRIVNNGGSDVPQGCAGGQSQCCYSDLGYLRSISNICTPLDQFSNGPPWTQGCFSNSPRQGNGKRCGERSFLPLSNLGRGEASPQEFPWACMLLDGSNNFVGTCAIVPESFNNDITGGTSKVITAAHKLDKIGPTDQLKVRVNEYNANDYLNPPEPSRHIEYTVIKITVHPEYRPKRFINDVAVLQVDRPIDLLGNNGVNAACLPHCPEMFDYKFPNGTGTRCWTAGWGKDHINGNFQPIMHKVDVPIYDEFQCESALKRELARKSSSAATRLKLHPSEMCAGGEAGKDACDGDGGAPLVCQANTGQWYVMGLVTWGVDCALQDVPGVYARISYFQNFIQNPEFS